MLIVSTDVVVVVVAAVADFYCSFINFFFFSYSLLQPLRLDIKRRLTSRSDRVKCVDLHPAEPWMLCALYNGHVHVMNYENQQLYKDFEVILSET